MNPYKLKWEEKEIRKKGKCMLVRAVVVEYVVQILWEKAAVNLSDWEGRFLFRLRLNFKSTKKRKRKSMEIKKEKDVCGCHS